MAAEKKQVTGGIDTHSEEHHAAAVDQTGRVLGDHEFPATAAGYRALLAWLRSYGTVVKIGVEGTGTYGAGLARYLAAESIVLVDVDRPDRRTEVADVVSGGRPALAEGSSVTGQ